MVVFRAVGKVDRGGWAVLCVLNEVTRPIIDELANATVLRWELIQNPYSQDARILNIAAPAASNPGDASPRQPPNEHR
jgi:hypothetical protein